MKYFFTLTITSVKWLKVDALFGTHLWDSFTGYNTSLLLAVVTQMWKEGCVTNPKSVYIGDYTLALEVSPFNS